ncbi:WD40-repeat-containing domain protein, partial [Chytriomyces sp. MP71]
MLVSSESKTATVGWSPAVSGCPAPLLAAATASGALDASFSTETTLDIFDPFVDDSDSPHRKTFKRLGSVTSNARFNRIAWGPGPDLVKRPMGIIAGGLESGDMALWDPRIILDNASKGGSPADPLVMKPFKHKGAVRGLDFNPVDPKFLASGAADGELLIWDLTNPTKPYNPGARSNRLDDVTAVAWNRMYHYILASASNNGNTVIWDLRNRNEIAAFSHPGGRKQISSISWNPDSPTQIVTASDDDANPVILVWDLRNSRAPEKVLSGHTQGILHVSWCPKDSDLLLSCGKDNRTIVWNMSTSSVIGDLHHSSNWSFEASWCHRNPDLVAVAGFDGKISIHSLQ